MTNSVNHEEALHAYNALKQGNLNDISEAVRKLKNMQDYLANLCNQIIKKEFKDKFIYQWTFTNLTSGIQPSDYDCYCKANLLSATFSLNRIISKIENEEVNDVRRRMLLDFVCDLKPFIANFDDKQDYSWLVSNTNTHITNFYHDLSENLFWNGMPGSHHEEHLTLSTSTPFIIRQSIEYKIKRVLGIDFLILNGKIHKTNPKVYFKVLKENLKYYHIKDLDFEIIETIHTWAHFYVHGGYRAKPWQIETAINYLKILFYSGETSQVNSYSLYAGVEVKEQDLEELIKSTEKTLKTQVNEDVNISWLTRPEVAVKKIKLNR